MTNTITTTSKDFHAVVDSETPTLVDFWADWCGPCHLVAPTLEQIAADHKGQLTVAKLNVDENPTVAQEYEVMSVPTLIIFQNGVEKKRLVGAQPRDDIEAELTKLAA